MGKDDESGGFIGEMLRDKELKEAFIAKLRAETTRAEFQAKTEEQVARSNLAQADIAEVMMRNAHREEAELLSTNKFHHVYVFGTEVTADSVGRCVDQLTKWSRLEPSCNMEIVLNSPGGGVIAGMAMYDYIIYLRSLGHNITTVALGHAASMAGILLQAGTTRVIGRESWLLIHEISFAAIGKIGEIEDTTEWVKRIQKRVLDVFSARSKLTPKQIEKRWKRKDWWLSSDDCLKLGLVDKVRGV